MQCNVRLIIDHDEKLLRRLTVGYALPGTPLLDINQKTSSMAKPKLAMFRTLLYVNGTGTRDNPAYVSRSLHLMNFITR